MHAFIYEVLVDTWQWFLLFYALVYTLLCFGIEFIQRRNDGSRKLPPLELPTEQPNPYEFAALRAGQHEIVRLFIFELIATGLITLTTNKKGKVTRESELCRTDKTPDDVPALSPEGQTCLRYFEQSRDQREFFDSPLLQTLAETRAKSFNKYFEEEHLVRLEHERHVVWLAIACAVILSFCVCLAMILYLATQAKGDQDTLIPIFFFGFFGWFAGAMFMSMYFIFNNVQSYRGKRYVKAVQKHFQPVLSPHGGVIDALFAVGIMGIPILAGTRFADFAKWFTYTGGDGGVDCDGGGD
jgi:uncharacterized protein (TIGR04222 family)